MAIYATRSRDPRPHRHTMIGSPVNLGFDRVTVSTLDRSRLFLMRNLTDVRMTGSAEILAVNGATVFHRIDLVVASKTILIPDLIGSAECARA